MPRETTDPAATGPRLRGRPEIAGDGLAEYDPERVHTKTPYSYTMLLDVSAINFSFRGFGWEEKYGHARPISAAWASAIGEQHFPLGLRNPRIARRDGRGEWPISTRRTTDGWISGNSAR